MDTPLVSIIVPCYMQAQYLPDALDSVLAQTYPHWECVVVNDASPDDTEDIVEKYRSIDTRIRKLTLPKNSGLPLARNLGIGHSAGTYILPLDADDKLHPEFLEKTLKVLQENNHVKVVYTDVWHFGEHSHYGKRPDVDMTIFCMQNLFQPTALFRRTDFAKTKGYRTRIYGYEDWDLWLQLIRVPGDAYRIPEGLFYVRVKKQSMIVELKTNVSLEQQLRRQLYLYNRPVFQKWFPLQAFVYERHLPAWNRDFFFLLKYKAGRLLQKLTPKAS